MNSYQVNSEVIRIGGWISWWRYETQKKACMDCEILSTTYRRKRHADWGRIYMYVWTWIKCCTYVNWRSWEIQMGTVPLGVLCSLLIQLYHPISSVSSRRYNISLPGWLCASKKKKKTCRGASCTIVTVLTVLVHVLFEGAVLGFCNDIWALRANCHKHISPLWFFLPLQANCHICALA